MKQLEAKCYKDQSITCVLTQKRRLRWSPTNHQAETGAAQHKAQMAVKWRQSGLAIHARVQNSICAGWAVSR